MDRRGFLGTMLALGAAPAIVRAESLMKIVVPKRDLLYEGRPIRQGIYGIEFVEEHELYGDGIHDDTAALQAWFDGKTVIDRRTGFLLGSVLSYGHYKMTDTLQLCRSPAYREVTNCRFDLDLADGKSVMDASQSIGGTTLLCKIANSNFQTIIY